MPEVPRMITFRQRRLPGMDELVAQLAAYFRTRTRLPDEKLARLALAARAAVSRWNAMAAACGITTYEDLHGVIYRITGETGAELLFSTTQQAVGELAGGECSATGRSRRSLPIHCQRGSVVSSTYTAYWYSNSRL